MKANDFIPRPKYQDQEQEKCVYRAVLRLMMECSHKTYIKPVKVVLWSLGDPQGNFLGITGGVKK